MTPSQKPTAPIPGTRQKPQVFQFTDWAAI